METRKIPVYAAVALLVIGFAFFSGNKGILANFVLMAMLVGVIPFVLMSYFEFHNIRLIEEQLPVFLRDLAESQKAGMSLPDALKIASKTDYKLLSKEIKKLNDQLSWGVPLQEVLDRFSSRMKGSPLIRRIIRVINEAYSSGGDIANVMESTSTDVTMIKEAELERKSLMSQHVTTMYLLYFIFIAIVLVLSKTLLPMLQIGGPGGFSMAGIGGFQDPCQSCVGQPQFFCSSCAAFSLLGAMFALGTGAVAYYKSLFFSMIMVQGIFSGLVAGQIERGSMLAGVKHCLIMTASGFAIFMLTTQLGII